MVKKSSFLDKIVNRFRTGSLRVEDRDPRRRGASPEVDETAGVPVRSVPEEVIPDSRRKLSKQENAALTMTQSFSELSSLLRGVQIRMEGHGGRLEEMNDNLSKLPAAATAQLEVLQSLVSHLEKQNSVNSKMVETFAELPDVMKGVQESLARTVATDERTAQTLDQFKSTMDRIQDSMGDMVESTQVQANAASTLAKDHSSTVQRLESTTEEGLKALRWSQEDQANRMAKLAGENNRWNRGIIVLLILSFAALVSIFVAIVGA